jgi:hypothetical protein
MVAVKNDDRFLIDDAIEEQNRLMTDTCLWWLLWGEAANLRFMPELISFMFYTAKNDMNQDRTSQRSEGDYLRLMVKPVYELLKHEVSHPACCCRSERCPHSTGLTHWIIYLSGL